MLNKIIEYLGKPDSGCWDLEATADMIRFKSVWGNGEIFICPKKKREDVAEFQTSGAGSNVIWRALGQPELSSVYEEDGVEISRRWFLEREAKHTQSTDILKDFVKECEMRRISNEIKTGYVSFQAGGNELFTVSNENKISISDRDSSINLAEMLNEIMDKYTDGEGNFYINNKAYICE